MSQSFRAGRRGALAVAAGLAAGLASVVGAGPASAKGGVVDGGGNEFFLTNTWSATAEINFYLGTLGDVASFPDFLLEYVVGDWDGDDADTVALRYGKTYVLRNTLESGPASARLDYGRPHDTVLVGDWDGDGIDSLAVRRGRVYLMRNELSSGPASLQVEYGREDDAVLVGDWDGDGDDTLAVRRGATYYFTNALAAGPAQFTQTYGRATDDVVVGDWDGDGVDTLAVRRANVFHLTNSFAAGPAEAAVTFGRTSDGALVGDWDGDGSDTLGVRRDTFSIGEGTHLVGADAPPGTYRSDPNPYFGECSWERRSSVDGGPGENVIASGGARISAIVTISPTDVAFASSCPPWRPIEATYPMSPLTAFHDGMYEVGRHIQPGTYLASEPGGSCTWARLSGFGGTPDAVVDSGGGHPQETVTIPPSDVGFATAGCGPWERQG